ncbi:MAG TPA: hypothetical protein GXX22_05095 [Clostridiales bacterium]|nr:hypothetical protein [Clostridiales bacterium]
MKRSRLQHRYRYFWLAIAALVLASTVFSAFALPVCAIKSGTPDSGNGGNNGGQNSGGGNNNTPETDPPFTVTFFEDKSGGVPMLTAGTKALIKLPFMTLSNYPGLLLNVTATLSSPADDPMQFTTSSLYKTQNFIWLNTVAYFDYEIEVPITAKPGIHSLTLNIAYKAQTLEQVPQLLEGNAKLTYYYTIINDNYEAIVGGNPLRITGSILPDSVRAGDVFEVGIMLQNDIPADVSGVSVKISYPAGFLLLNDANTKIVNVPASGSARVTFRVTAGEDIKGGPQQFTLDLSYANPGGKEFTMQYYMIVNAVGSPEEEADKNPATVEITGITLPESASAGDEFVAVVTLANTSEKNAVIDELKVTNTLGILNRTNAVFTGITLTAGEVRSFEIRYFVPEQTQTDYANFTVSLKYKTEGGTLARQAEITGGMNINALASPSLSISLSADESVKAGNTFTVTAIVKNRGGDASNVTVTVNPASGIVPKSQNMLVIENLPGGSEYKCTFQLLATDSAQDGYNLVGVDVVCGDKIKITQFTGTNVINPKKGEEEPKADMPVIIIDSYDYGGESVYAGKPFTLTLTIKNTSRTTPIRDMKMVIQSKDGTFTPTSSSNTFFVESLGPGQTVTREIELVAKSDSKPLSYPIEIVITYKNNVGDAGTSTEEISIPVQQEIRFNKGTLSEIGTVTIPDSAYLLVSASNLGMSTIRNVRFAISGEGFTATEPEYFAGTIEPGQQVSHEFELIPYMGGFLTGTVTYTYEDTQGQVYTEAQDFSFEVIDTSAVINPEFPGDLPSPEEPGIYEPGMGEEQGLFAKFMWPIIGGAGVVVVITIAIVVAVIVKNRKKREEDEFDEGDE